MKKLIGAVLTAVFLSTASHAGQKVPVRIGYPSVGTLINGQVGVVLEKTDILEQNGFDAEVTAFPYGPPMQEALLSGKLDVVFTSETNVVKILAKGYPGTCVASLGTAGRLGLLVPAASKVHSLEDLKGKTVATVFGSSAHTPIVRWAKEASLLPGNIHIINMDGGESRLALLRGDIDAVMTWDPYIEDMMRKGQARLIKQAPMHLAVIVSNEFVQKHPEAVTDLLVGVKEAAYYMVLHKNEVNRWYGDLCRIDPAVIDAASQANAIYGRAKTARDIDISVSKELSGVMERTNTFLFDEKLISRSADLSSAIDRDFAKKADIKARKTRRDARAVNVIR